jgi:glycosyltransferase involved in cell wall biosynthesis
MYFDPKEEVIRCIYRQLLGRDPEKEGLQFYKRINISAEDMYLDIYNSPEAIEYRNRKIEEVKATSLAYPITLAMFVKNCESSVAKAINSVKSVVREIVVVDTGSTDSTVEICEGLGARVYKIGFSDFGSVRTITGHLSREEWVLGLDSDETILEEDLPLFDSLIKEADRSDIDAWALPRKRWLDLDMKVQLEKDVYPDWQYRFFRNKTNLIYKRRIHEVLSGTKNTKHADKGPTIQHFQDSYKSGSSLLSRNEMYKKLYALDIEDGVAHEGRAVQELDER